MTEYLQEDQVKANITLWQTLKGLWPYGKGYRRYFWISAAAVVTVGVSSRILPTLIGIAIDDGIMKNDSSMLVKMALAFLLVQSVYAVSNYIYSYYFQKFGNRLLFNLREKLHDHVQHLPVAYFDRTPTGRIVTRLTNDTENLAGLASDGLVNVVVDGIILFSIVTAMILISPLLTLATLFVTPFFIWLSLVLSNRMKVALRDSKKKFSELNSFASERINGMKTVQILNLQSAAQETYSRYSKDYRNVLMKSLRTSALLHPTMNLYNAITITIALGLGGYFSLEFGLSVGALVAFLLHVQDTIPNLREILDKYQQFQNSITSSERVFQLLDEPAEASGKIPAAANRFLDIEFRGLTFHYQPGLKPALVDLDLKIPQGTRAAVIGRTGSGKSTLISLLMKFYAAEPRELWIGGRPIEEWSTSELRSQIGLVQQDPFLFRGSLVENVTLGKEGLAAEDVKAAFEKLGYWPLLARSGRDHFFQVEERGANLSAGERQIIAFARVMVHQPQLLILDEATANIDSETEAVLQAATEVILRGRTSIVIAHRLSTIQNSDCVFVLSEGRLIESGSPKDLIDSRGMFFDYLNEGSTKALS